MAGAPILNVDCTDYPELTTSVATVGLCLSDTTPIAVVVTRNCNGVTTEDGWIDLTSGTFTAGSPPPGTGACNAGDNLGFALSGWLCDILPDGSVAGIALVQIGRDASGAVIGITLIGVDGLPYIPMGIITRCPEDRLAVEVLCDSGAANVPFVRFYTYSPSGTIPVRDTDLDGIPYVVFGPVIRCSVTIDGQPIEVTNPSGNPIDIEGIVKLENQFDDEYVILCDTVTTFQRRYRTDLAGNVSVADSTLGGAPYVPIGAVGVCPTSVTNRRDIFSQILCDNVTSFLRSYTVNNAGVVTITDTTVDGTTAYVPVGVVSRCSSIPGGVGTNTASIIVTRVSGAFPVATAQRITSALARRVTILWENNSATVATRPTLNGVTLFQQSSQGGAAITLGDLATGGTLPSFTIRTNLISDDLTVVEEL